MQEHRQLQRIGWRQLLRRAPSRARAVGLLSLALLVVLPLHPGEAYGQTSIGVEVAGGATLPVGAFDRFVPRLDPELSSAAEGPSQLFRTRPAPGFHLALAAHVGALSVRYRFTRAGWRDDQLQCGVDEGARGTTADTAYIEGNGEIDDSAVIYDCNQDRALLEPVAGRGALVLHDLFARFRLQPRRSLPVIPALLLGGGFSLTTFDANATRNPLRLGLLLSAGGSVRIPVDTQLSVVLDATYDLRVISQAGSYALRASRAVQADRSIASALFSPLHAFSFNLGIVFLIR